MKTIQIVIEIISFGNYKLCRQRQMSATAVHFSMTAIRAAKFGRRIISDATSLETLEM